MSRSRGQHLMSEALGHGHNRGCRRRVGRDRRLRTVQTGIVVCVHAQRLLKTLKTKKVLQYIECTASIMLYGSTAVIYIFSDMKNHRLSIRYNDYCSLTGLLNKSYMTLICNLTSGEDLSIALNLIGTKNRFSSLEKYNNSVVRKAYMIESFSSLFISSHQAKWRVA